MTTALLSLQFAATLAMTGLIWFVQIVHYPLFAAVGPAGFSNYENAHQRLTGHVVVPLMGLEAVTALACCLVLPGFAAKPATWTGLVLLLTIWASTAFLQMPCHRVLSQGFDEAAHCRLVRSNWIRTLAWTGRSVLLGVQVAGVSQTLG